MSYPAQRRSFGPKKRTAADKKTAAIAMLLWRPKLGDDEIAILMRSYGQTEKNARQLVKEERERRNESVRLG